MRKVIASLYVTLDGVMEEPAWTVPYCNDEISRFKFDELFASDALLLGRATYEGFAKAWPSMTDEQGFADRMNSLPKFVASTTLQNPEWNAAVIGGDVAQEVSALKQQPGQDILIYGSADLVQTLLPLGLVDELRLLIYPVVLGSGKRLFNENSKTTLKLAEARPLGPEVVALIYRSAAGES